MKLTRRIRRLWRYWFPYGGLRSLRELESLGFRGNLFLAFEAERVSGRIEFVQPGNNTVEIGAGSDFSGVILVRGSGNIVRIGPGCTIRGRITVKGMNQRVIIGENTTFAGVSILAQENCDVIIGSHCMFSRDIEIRTSDSHSVIAKSDLRRLNKPASVKIGNHVWLGLRCIVNKGAKIPDDSVVGAAAFVNKAFDETGIILAGSPAKIVKRGVTWQRERKNSFKSEQLGDWGSR